MTRPCRGFLASSLLLFACSSAEIGPEHEGPGLEVAEYDYHDSCADESCMEPVIWVHGCPPPEIDAATASHFADVQKQVFLEAGYPAEYLHSFVFEGAKCDSNIEYAAQLSDMVFDVLDQTGAARVNIVAHSMGALASRVYIAAGGYRYVRDFVSIGGGNHGSEVAGQGAAWQEMFGWPNFEGAKEMFPPYACWGESSNGESWDAQYWVNGCLAPWGRWEWADETPADDQVDYLSIWNTVDEFVVPQEAACLNQSFANDCSSSVNQAVTVPPGPGPCGPMGCPAHVTIMWDPGVILQVFEFITLP